PASAHVGGSRDRRRERKTRARRRSALAPRGPCPARPPPPPRAATCGGRPLRTARRPLPAATRRAGPGSRSRAGGAGGACRDRARGRRAVGRRETPPPPPAVRSRLPPVVREWLRPRRRTFRGPP